MFRMLVMLFLEHVRMCLISKLIAIARDGNTCNRAFKCRRRRCTRVFEPAVTLPLDEVDRPGGKFDVPQSRVRVHKIGSNAALSGYTLNPTNTRLV